MPQLIEYELSSTDKYEGVIKKIIILFCVKVENFKPIFHWKLGLRWLPTKNVKCTWPTPALCAGDPTPPIFHLLSLGVGVGGNTNVNVRVGANANFSVFRYQHVGIPNAKLCRLGSKATPGPNANGFASQWNIGFRSSTCTF